MEKNKLILFIPIALIIGFVLGSVLPSKVNPLKSKASYKSVKEDFSDVKERPGPMPNYDLNSDGYLSKADIEAERLCVIGLSKDCSIQANDFSGNGELGAEDVVLISRAVYKSMYDLNKDGTLDKNDTQVERDCVVGLIKCIVKQHDFNENDGLDAGDVVIINNYISNYVE